MGVAARIPRVGLTRDSAKRYHYPVPENLYTQAVANTIRAELARRSLTQADLANALGVTQPAVSRRMTGQVPFDVEELAKAAALLGLPVSALIEDAA
jgi:predicted XRE-type DNA-binding protein